MSFEMTWRQRFGEAARLASGRGSAVRRRRRDRDRHRSRPAVLALEDRRLLATFTVMNTNASGSGSLAAAVAAANANEQANTIVFDPSVFSTHQTITLGGSKIKLSDASGTQTVTGPAAGVTINGGGKSLVFQVGGGVTATLSGLTLSGGSTAGDGGGLFNEGTTTLTDCTISGNVAYDGGGLINYTALSLTGCTLSGNVTYNAGGGALNFGALSLTGCTLSGNVAYGGGGGLVNLGTANLTGCTISGNSGGGFYEGTGAPTLTDTIIAGNGHNDIWGLGGLSDHRQLQPDRYGRLRRADVDQP